jgi:hypothetical protein
MMMSKIASDRDCVQGWRRGCTACRLRCPLCILCIFLQSYLLLSSDTGPCSSLKAAADHPNLQSSTSQASKRHHACLVRRTQHITSAGPPFRAPWRALRCQRASSITQANVSMCSSALLFFYGCTAAAHRNLYHAHHTYPEELN